ncbi:MAG: methionyl-tRNA formyltransferase [Lachnospiraceae bacterium]|jgi:methionyl-tRNA formyltransferase
MRLVFMGTPDFSVGTLEALLAAGHEIVGVVTQPDKPKGRGKTLLPTPVKEVALEHALPVYQPQKARDPQFIEQLRSLKPEAIIVVAFGQLLPKAILDMPPYGCINVHASLLPKYRGAAPIQWAVIDGEKETGVTIMRMDEGLDTGDMIAKTVVTLEPDETGGSLFDKLSREGASLCVKTLEEIEAGCAVYEKQPKESTTDYARMIDKKMGEIDWDQDAQKIEQLVRGLNPWPSAYTYMNGKILKIWKAQVLQETSQQQPGQVVKAEKDQLYIQTGKGILKIQELQLEGKKRMETGAFLRGHTVEVNTRLGR